MAAESSHRVLEIPKELLALLSILLIISRFVNLCGLLLSKLMAIVWNLFWSSILYLQLVPALSQLEKESVTGREWMHFFQRSDYNQSLSCSQLLVNWVPLNFLVFMHLVWTPNQISQMCRLSQLMRRRLLQTVLFRVLHILSILLQPLLHVKTFTVLSLPSNQARAWA